jgi:hypothetical protein
VIDAGVLSMRLLPARANESAGPRAACGDAKGPPEAD